MSFHKLYDIHQDTSMSDQKHQNTCSSGNIKFVSIHKVQVELPYMKEGDGRVLFTFQQSFMPQVQIQTLLSNYFWFIPFSKESFIMSFKPLYSLFNLRQCEPLIMIYYLPVYLLYLFVASPPITFFLQFPSLQFFLQMPLHPFLYFEIYLNGFPFKQWEFLNVYHEMLLAFIKMKSCPSMQCRILFQG